jgi:hypothetical protein
MMMLATSSKGTVRSGSPSTRQVNCPSLQESAHCGESMLMMW